MIDYDTRARTARGELNDFLPKVLFRSALRCDGKSPVKRAPSISSQGNVLWIC